MNREQLGRIVRATWVQYCQEIGDAKESHLTPWEELSEQDKEADRRIGEAVVKAMGDERRGRLRERQKEAIRRAQEYRVQHGDPVDDLVGLLSGIADEETWQSILDEPH